MSIAAMAWAFKCPLDDPMDQCNTAVRHIMERGGCKRLGLTGKDTDGTYHLAKAIWRLNAQLQLDLEEERGLGPSRGSK